MGWAIDRSAATGVCIGLTVTLAYLGNLWGVPASALTVVSAVAAVWLAFAGQKLRANRANMVFYGVAVVLYAALVVQSASAEQWRFMLSVSNWRSHAQTYYASKLMTFVVAFAPIAVAAAAAMQVEDKQQTARGILWGILTVALLLLIRVLPHASSVVGVTAAEYSRFAHRLGSLGIGLTGVGFAAMLGVIASLSLPKMFYLSPVLFAEVFLFNRRTESTVAAAAILVFAITQFIRWHPNRRKSAFRAAYVVLGSCILVGSLHTEANVEYWAALESSAQTRSQIIEQAVAGSAEQAATEAGSHGEKQLSVWVGRGLGWYAIINPEMEYPHNLLVEAYTETGVLSLALLLVVVLGVLGYSAAVVRARREATWVGLFGVLLALAVAGSKAGDITLGSRIYALAVIVGLLTGLPDAFVTVCWGRFRGAGAPPSRSQWRSEARSASVCCSADLALLFSQVGTAPLSSPVIVGRL